MQKRVKPIDVSLLIPACNEEGNIQPLLDKIEELKHNTDYSIETIIVNDGSTDNTQQALEECGLQYDLTHIKHTKTLGITAALKTAFHHSNGKFLVFIPADLQYLPECVPDLVAPLNDGYDFVCGKKKGKYDKKFVSTIYNRLTRLLFRNVNVSDLNSVKAFKREVFESIDLRKDWHRYFAVLAAEMGYRTTEVEVKLYPRVHGESKYSGKSRILVGLLDLLSVKFLISFSKKPLLSFGTFGIILVLLGFAVGLEQIVARVIFKAAFRPALYLVILLEMAGITFFAIGFIAEMIATLNERLENLEKILTDRKCNNEIEDKVK